MPVDVTRLSATELCRLLRAGEVSAVDAVTAFQERISARNGQLNAYVTRLDGTAQAAARAADAALADGRPMGPLHGLPIAIKDLFDTLAGVRKIGRAHV